MEITDSPHKPGTPEHNKWVTTVFIPSEYSVRLPGDRLRAGAPTIGKQLVTSVTEMRLQNRRDSGESIEELDLVAAVEAMRVAFKELGRQLTEGLAVIGESLRRSFPELLARPASTLVGKPAPIRRVRMCPTHGQPAPSCKFCQRARR